MTSEPFNTPSTQLCHARGKCKLFVGEEPSHFTSHPMDDNEDAEKYEEDK